MSLRLLIGGTPDNGLKFRVAHAKGRYLFSWGEWGRAGEFWYFFQKKVLALPHVLIKENPDPPLLGD